MDDAGVHMLNFDLRESRHGHGCGLGRGVDSWIQCSSLGGFPIYMFCRKNACLVCTAADSLS